MYVCIFLKVIISDLQQMPLSGFHCMKSVQIRSFSWSVFSRIRTEYGKIRSMSPYSVRMRENTDQKNSAFGHFSRSVLSLISDDKLRILTIKY